MLFKTEIQPSVRLKLCYIFFKRKELRQDSLCIKTKVQQFSNTKMSLSLKDIGNSLVPEDARKMSEYEEEEEFQRQLDQALKISLSDMGQTRIRPGHNGTEQRTQRLPTSPFVYPANGTISRVVPPYGQTFVPPRPAVAPPSALTEEDELRFAMELSMKPSEQVSVDDQLLFRAIEDSKLHLGVVDRSSEIERRVLPRPQPGLFGSSDFGPPLHDVGNFYHHPAPPPVDTMILEDEALARKLAEEEEELAQALVRPYAQAAKKVHLPQATATGAKNVYADPGRLIVAPVRTRPKPEPGARRRHIVVDGCNVAFEHGKHDRFSARGLQIVYEYFVNKFGYTEDDLTIVIKHIPHLPPEDTEIIECLKKIDVLLISPGRVVGDKKIISDDDLFILELARDKNGIVISKDHFRPYQDTKDKGIRDVIRKRVLQFTFKGNEVYFPSDPLGKGGITLDEFLKY